MLTLNPFRLYRRWRRLRRDAREEAAKARQRHGAAARDVLERKLADPAVTAWGRRVIRKAVRLL